VTLHPAAPIRIQRRRTRGWRMPAGAVYVGRPSAWGNRHQLDSPHPRARTISLRHYIIDMARSPKLVELARRELRGKDLSCWCPLTELCHADVLLAIANSVGPWPCMLGASLSGLESFEDEALFALVEYLGERLDRELAGDAGDDES
jgi:hypothetical protein